MDIEPKYNDKKNLRFVASFGVIFYTGDVELRDQRLSDILIKIVASRNTPNSQWRFLKTVLNYPYQKIQHRGVSFPILVQLKNRN